MLVRHVRISDNMKATQQLHDMSQRLWLGNINRDLLTSGTLGQYINQFSVTGLKSHNLRPGQELPSFLAVAGFESKIGMAMFVRLLGDEATCCDTHLDRSQRCRNESLNQEEEYMTLRIPQIILAVAILTPCASLHSQTTKGYLFPIDELCSADHQLSSGQAIPRFGVISRCPRDLSSLGQWLRL